MSLLELKDASITFGGLRAVAPLSFTLPRGQLAAIIGPNGAGKTTVFNLLTGVYAPTSGEIWFDEKRIAAPGKSLPPHQMARRGIARTFQNIRLFSEMSVEDNVRCAFFARAGYGLGATFLRSAKALQQEKWIENETANLLNVMRLTSRASTRARNLPYGDQRRLEIARALATQPKLLLLDEPTSGMNPTETEEVTKIIGEVRERFDLSILLIEHHMSLVMKICERVIVLDGGVLLADDAPQKVRDDPHVIAAYLGESDAEVEEAIESGYALV